MVQRGRRPGEVDRVALGHALVEVGVQRGDPLGEPDVLSPAPQTLDHLGGPVDRQDVRIGELLQEPERAGPRACPEVEDAAYRRVDQRSNVGTDGAQRPRERLGVEVEQVRETVLTAVTAVTAVGMVVVWPAALVMVMAHGPERSRVLRQRHTLLRMTQDGDLDVLVRQRLRGLRVARGWSLDDLAGRCFLSASTLSRIETGHRRISLDQLTAIARTLGTSIDQLVEPEDDHDVVIRPHQDEARGMTTWLLSRDQGPHGLRVAKIRLTQPPLRRGDGELPVHPGRDWFTVLSGTVLVVLGERTIRVDAGQAAEFSTMVPHAFGADGGPAEIIAILDPDGERSHLRP